MWKLLFRWRRLSRVLRRLRRSAWGSGDWRESRPRRHRLSRSAAEVPRRTIKRHRTGQQAAAVGLRHVNEEPVFVVILFVEHANAFLLAGASDSEDRSSTERLSVEAGAGIGTRI